MVPYQSFEGRGGCKLANLVQIYHYKSLNLLFADIFCIRVEGGPTVCEPWRNVFFTPWYPKNWPVEGGGGIRTFKTCLQKVVECLCLTFFIPVSTLMDYFGWSTN